MTEQDTRRIAREEIARALEAMRPQAHEVEEDHCLVVGDVDRALAALRAPEPSAEPVMLWRAWQANGLSVCFESAFPVRVHPRGHLEFEVSRGAWRAGMPLGVRSVSSRNGEKPGVIEWIGPGPDPREERDYDKDFAAGRAAMREEVVERLGDLAAAASLNEAAFSALRDAQSVVRRLP